MTTRTGFLAWPALSPDGETIASASTDNLGDNIYLYPESGGPPRSLTSFSGSREDPRWSPDGRRIAYQRWRADMRIPGIAMIDITGGSEHAVLENVVQPGMTDWLAPDRLVVAQAESLLVVDTVGHRTLSVPIPDTLGDVVPPIEVNPVSGLTAYWSGRLGGLVAADLQGRQFRVLYRGAARLLPLEWQHDGALLAGKETDELITRSAGVTSIVRVPRGGGPPTTVMAVDRACRGLTVGGGGRVVGCSVGASRPDVWLADQPGRSGW